jgi:flagellar L-ring protein precursor FlgH
MKTMSRSASSLAILLLTLAASAASAQSLWPVDGGSERAIFADRKAAHAGDILTVVISESANATNTQKKSSERASTTEDALSKFLFTPGASRLGTHNGALPSFSFGGSGSHTGGGQVNNSQSLTSRAAVLVTDVLPNGNLVIEGKRVVTFSGETQYVVLHGIVRPEDVSPANTVFSSNVADARVEFISEGSLTEAQKRGWLSKLYERFRPF